MQKNERKDAVQLMLRFVRGSLGLFALGLICSMLNTACNSLTPQIIRMTVDSVIGSGEMPGWFQTLGLDRLMQSDVKSVLLLAAAAVLVTAVLSGIFSFFARLNTAKASERAIKSLRDELFGISRSCRFPGIPRIRPARLSSAAPPTLRSSATLSAHRW